MKNVIGIVCVLVSITLTACGGGSSGSTEPRVVNYTPDLRRFDIIDSYGVDTALSSAPLTISPSVDNGLFDVFWKVDSLEDYRMNIRINDGAGISNSLLIYSEICGLGRSCDQGGNVICEYTSDFRLACGNGALQDILELFPNSVTPQDLYLILEVCDLDSSFCTYEYHSVRMR